ncbi:MAG: hypothetical protein U5K51_02500 [Flavobacteriaceae bacterium]|nr:hypothetical protein [Flavobacteriaceae bacterium]
MKYKNRALKITSLFLGIIVFAIGVLNLLLVHPVPGFVFLILSLLYLPQTDALFKKRMGFTLPPVLKIFLAILVIWFTLGVSDLGDIIDDWSM